jgi:Domain of unknown function (DUF3883)
MNVAKRADGLLPAKQTIALLEVMERYPRGLQENNLLQDLAAFYPPIWSRGRNTITLLRTMAVIKERDGLISIADTSIDDWPRALGQLVAEILVRKISDENLGGCLQADVRSGGLWLDSMMLPGSEEGLPLWVIEFTVATRERIGSRFWRVSDAYEPLFLRGARAANCRNVQRSMSAAELEEKLDRDALHGKEAEEWVLAFEHRRLANHPLIDQVRRISDENVSAGFDIVSFSSLGTLHHDLFIEVKSYGGPKRFFWTRTEIAKAEELGERYNLYLLDRSRINSADYKPQIIPGPYAALFQSQASGWTISPTTFECVAPTEY